MHSWRLGPHTSAATKPVLFLAPPPLNNSCSRHIIPRTIFHSSSSSSSSLLSTIHPQPRRTSSTPAMAAGHNDAHRAYEDALNCLSSLITRRTRADGSNKGDSFDLMFDYLKMLDLEGPLSQLKVVHVAGTKGKGSTCTFAESILRQCGLRTGLFTSPHLIDVRERFRLDGVEISEDKFLDNFWWCWDKLQKKTDNNVPMPTYFRFLALLAFKIFTAEQVDVAVLEVGLGGKFDATNAVQAPVVCGITSLGYDHMEILGNTLGEIAGEKAGIFKKGVPAYTVKQPEEAMSMLEDKASTLGISLEVAPPLDKELLGGQSLGLDGEHQYLNAGLAIALCHTLLKKIGHPEGVFVSNNVTLSEPFVRGLTMASLQGRAQVVPDSSSNSGGLVFYLDGAHSPESLEMCARWFSQVVKEEAKLRDSSNEQSPLYSSSKQILLFNCLSVRDPQLLLPPLVKTCAHHGVHFHKALFVPNQSVFNKVGSHMAPPPGPEQGDLSWQLAIQRVWENLINGEKAVSDSSMDANEGRKQEDMTNSRPSEGSSVLPSLPLAIKWLRENVKQNRSVHFQVLVTGSVHLVGDVLRLIKK